MSTTSTLIGASGGSGNPPTEVVGGTGITVQETTGTGGQSVYLISNDLGPITSVDGSVTIVDTNPGVDLSVSSSGAPVTINGAGDGGTVTQTAPNEFNIEFFPPTKVTSADGSILVNTILDNNNGVTYDLVVNGGSSTPVTVTTDVDPRLSVDEPTPGNYLVKYNVALMKAEMDFQLGYTMVGPVNDTNWFNDPSGRSSSFTGLTFLQDAPPAANLRIRNDTGIPLLLRSRLFLQIRNTDDNDRLIEVGIHVTTGSGSVLRRDPTDFLVNKNSNGYTSIYYECVFGLGDGATVYPYTNRTAFGFSFDVANMRWIVE